MTCGEREDTCVNEHEKPRVAPRLLIQENSNGVVCWRCGMQPLSGVEVGVGNNMSPILTLVLEMSAGGVG